MKTIPVSKEYDRCARREVVLGDLTEKQYAALEKVADLSPGYHFHVVRYEERRDCKGSAATHVKIFRDTEDRDDSDENGLVGRDYAQYYDNSKETEAVVKRVAHRVYRRAGIYFR